LQEEVFIFDVQDDLPEQLSLDGYNVNVLDTHSMEISVQKNQGLNAVFKVLSEKNIQVLSMRSKANRLEELFVKLVAGEKA
jgi:ABC-2 type transport system ATP-binding protein